MPDSLERLDRTAWLDIAALGITQIVAYGTLYYSFGILAPAMALDLGWPTEWATAYSASSAEPCRWLFGPEGYGPRQDQLMSVRLIIGSAAPFAFALMADRMGIEGALWLSAILGCCSIAALAFIGRLTPSGAPVLRPDLAEPPQEGMP